MNSSHSKTWMTNEYLFRSIQWRSLITGNQRKKKHRSSFKNSAINYISSYLRENTFNGFARLADNNIHPAEFFIWSCLIFVVVYFTATLSFATWKRYQENPTVTTIEKDNLFWNNTFPAVTVCPTTKIDEKSLDRFVEQSTAGNKTLLKEFVESLTRVTYRNLEDIVEYDFLSSDQYLQTIMDVQFDFPASVSIATMENRKFKLVKVISEMGICYTFNSIIASYSSPDYWKDGSWDLLPQDDILTINALDGEVLANIVNISSGFELYIHGPYEVADTASKSINSPNGYFLQVYLEGLTLFSSERIRDLNIKQRKCRFYDESDLRHSPAYSYVLCRMECRATLAKKLCGCVPHFYRKLDGEKVCDVKGLHCLAQYKERLIILKGECKCLANCNEVNYLVADLDTREWFLGSNLQWGLKEYPKMRLRRDVIFGFSDLLVYIGGMAGLFLGCSVLSFIEIIYFFTLRLYWYVVKYREDTKRICQ